MSHHAAATRRHILQALLASAAGLPALGAQAAEPGRAQRIAACDWVTGIDFTTDEEQQIAEVIDDQLDALRALMAHRPGNALAPAEIFDPRLPDWRPRVPLAATGQGAAPGPIPGNADDIAFASLAGQAAWLRTGALTSLQLTEIYLQRIARLDGTLQSFITVTADQARAQAAERDRELATGTDRGPLHGIPYGLKDLIDAAATPTSWGATPYRDRVADADAHVVRRLRDAGAVLLGKTSCGALAYGDLWYGGQCRNPWNVAEGSSGSSAGSAAAVAAGLCAFAIGTETMGSIISPANRSGATGLRPSFGRVGRSGTMALCWSLDKIGVLARNAQDTALVLAAINGADPADPASIAWPFRPGHLPSLRGMTLGYDPRWFEADGTAALDRDILAAAKDAGMTLVEITLPALPYQALGPIVTVESAAAFETLTIDGLDDALRWQDDAAWPNTWRAARFLPAVSYVQMQRLRRRVMAALADAVAGVDIVAHPNFAGHMLAIANHAGYPSIGIRIGFIDQPARTLFQSYIPPDQRAPDAVLARVPRNISLTGHLFDEARLIAVAAVLERLLGHAQARPPLAS